MTIHPPRIVRLRLWFIVLIATVSSINPHNALAGICPTIELAMMTSLSSDLVIGQISVRNGDLFDLTDPAQGRFVHSAANSLHRATRAKTVRAALPFRSGDSFNKELLAEGERALREKRYLRDASVVPVQICENRVDVEVSTIDNWTLTPSISFGSAGGQNNYTIEIQDLNVLGLGKELKILQSQRSDERASTFLYGDDNVWGSRHQLRLELSDTNEGEQYSLQAGLPFYTNNAKRSWGFSIDSETNAFDSPNTPDISIPVKSEQAHIEFAKSLPQTTLPYARIGIGARYSRQITDLPTDDTGIVSSYDFEEVYPFITARWSHGDWVKLQNYKSIKTNEDLNIGLSVDLELGLVLEALNNDQDAVRLDIALSKAWHRRDQDLHKLNIHQINYFSSNDESKSALSVRYQYFRWIGRQDLLVILVTGETRHGYSPVHNFVVGGDEGLRGYPAQYQSGEQRLIGLAEYRHITSWSPWSLVHTAFTAFVESGRAWTDGDDANILADVGVGLLLSPTRSSTAAINRFDISIPLVHGENVGDYQIFIGTTINY